MSNVTEFLPDWVSPPGATVRDILKERGQTISDFAGAMTLSVADARKLLDGSAPITREVAILLSSVLGLSADFWLCRESQFRKGLVRLANNEQWLRELPVSDLTKFKWIRPARSTTDKIAACLEFFGVATVSDWWLRYEGSARLAAFRTSKSFGSTEAAVLAWLRKGELEADAADCGQWDRTRFLGALPSIRALTRQKEPALFIPELQRLCSDCGVAVVIEKAPRGCRASGATHFLDAHKAILMLSFRYLSDDHFWFTFFHEAGHLLLHDLSTTVLEGDHLCTGEEEEEANQFSANLLVPPEHQPAMRALPVNGRAVMRFARQIGISPGIVVGQLQHLGIFTHMQLNNLKERYSWEAD